MMLSLCQYFGNQLFWRKIVNSMIEGINFNHSSLGPLKSCGRTKSGFFYIIMFKFEFTNVPRGVKRIGRICRRKRKTPLKKPSKKSYFHFKTWCLILNGMAVGVRKGVKGDAGFSLSNAVKRSGWLPSLKIYGVAKREGGYFDIITVNFDLSAPSPEREGKKRICRTN